MSAPLPSFVVRSRAVAVASLLGLVALGLAWELWIAPLRPGGSWWAIKVLPLAFALPGLLRLRLYTYRWLSLLVWLYATEALVRGTTERPPGAALAWLQLVLALALFGACLWHVRGRLKAAAPAATAPGP
jgi:uncharacterized membrane protein